MITAPAGFQRLEASDAAPLIMDAKFVKGDIGVFVRCTDGGQFNLVDYQMRTLARTTRRDIAGTIVALSADPSFGPTQTVLDGASLDGRRVELQPCRRYRRTQYGG